MNHYHHLHCGFEAIVREPLQKVRYIHDNRARDWLRFEPLPCARQQLETATRILPQERKALDVGVRTDSHIDLFVSVITPEVRSRIMEANSVRAGMRNYAVQIVLRKVQG